MRYYRKIIKIKAEQSPNVRQAMLEIAAGKEPSHKVILQGVLTYADYLKRRATWDKVRQCVGLDAEFYEGAEVLLFPPEWLNRSEEIARGLRRIRKAKGIGIDPAEGGDKTCMVAVDELGLIELVARKTPDTNVISGEALAFMSKHNVPPERVCFDRGGGGKQHADKLRAQGYNVRTVAFGESLTPDPKTGKHRVKVRMEIKESQYVYKKRRAQMFGELSELVEEGWGIPAEYEELRNQLAVIPKLYDDEGRLWLPSKGQVTDEMKKRNVRTLIDIIGHSPDEADATVLAVFAMLHEAVRGPVITAM